MIQIGDQLISEDIFSEQFVCNLKKCKGTCCVEGDSGAPLDESETSILADIFPKIKKYLRPEGIAAIEEQGTHVVDYENDFVTPLVDGRECAYVIFDKNGITKCGIELAYEEKQVDFRKPISCHLYPIRIKEYKKFTAINYDEWKICKDACSLGKELKVPVYRFLKEALVRKYGEDWYKSLCEAAEDWKREFGHQLAPKEAN